MSANEKRLAVVGNSALIRDYSSQQIANSVGVSQLRIVVADVDAYEQFFFDKLSQIPGVQEITSSIALSRIKRTTVLPI